MRSLLRVLLLAAGVLVAAALPAQAKTKPCQAPPGRSAIVEYCEQIPGGHKARHATAPKAARRALQDAGLQGAAVLQLTRQEPVRRRVRQRPTPPPTSVSGLPFALGHAGSAGALLLWILLAAAVLLAAAAWLRRRRRSNPPAAS